MGKLFVILVEYINVSFFVLSLKIHVIYLFIDISKNLSINLNDVCLLLSIYLLDNQTNCKSNSQAS